jgi:hypothetical protein
MFQVFFWAQSKLNGLKFWIWVCLGETFRLRYKNKKSESFPLATMGGSVVDLVRGQQKMAYFSSEKENW